MEMERIRCDDINKVTCDGCGLELDHPLEPVFQLSLPLRAIILFFCYTCKRKLY